MHWIKRGDTQRLPVELRRLYQDFGVWKNGRVGCPRNFNRLTMAWYLNESKEPNVRCTRTFDFVTLRNIKSGEELTVDYSAYSDPAC